MSEKIVFRSSSNRIKGVKLNEILNLTQEVDESDSQQKQFEIELHNQFIKGFNEGQKEAINRLQKEYSEKLKEAYSLLDAFESKIDSQIKEQIQSIHKFVIQLSFEIAEKIIRREIAKDSPILKILEDTLGKLTSANDVTIKLNPSDLDLVESHLSQINKTLNSGKIHLQSDDRIEKGGCLIETEIGNADGRIISQLENIRHQLETYFEGKNA